jgi:uncharacterized membrane protein
MSSTVEKSVDVKAPLSTVYNQWTQFEEFPQFMEGVEEVKQISPKRLHWRAKVAGKVKEWEADIVEQTPDTRIAWRSSTGAENAGIVNFLPNPDGSTRVTAHITYETEGIVENVGDALGMVSARVQGDLDRFQKFVESKGSATGGWRGEIHAGKVESGQGGAPGGATSSPL